MYVFFSSDGFSQVNGLSASITSTTVGKTDYILLIQYGSLRGAVG